MTKRNPSFQLTHDNWNVEEEENEEPGHFARASKDELKRRVFKKAKRTIGSDSASAEFPILKSNPGPKTAFSGFSFTSGPTSDSSTEIKPTNGTKSAFSGFSLSSEKSEVGSKSKGSTSTKPDLSSFSFVNREVNFKSSTGHLTSNQDAKGNNNESSEDQYGDEKAAYSDAYYRSLKALNNNFLSWIQKYMKESNYCIFTPGFRDYEKHLDDLEKQFKIASSETVKKSTPSTGSLGFTPPSVSQLYSTLIEKSVYSALENSKTSTNDQTSPPRFSFADAAAKAAATAASKEKTEENDDAYSPPENEFKEVTEEEAFYTQKCKLFFKKSESFIEKGKGNLFLKKVDDKTQLIVRADTNLGNILLNIILNKSMPASRMGKNNVMIACVPNPPIDTKEETKEPIPMLIRVKTGEDADKLLENIESSK